jgi:hypothetical protein
MPIDIHVRVAAWLHIVMGALFLGVLAIVGMMFGVFGAAVGYSVHGQDAGVLGWIAGLGVTVFLFLAALPLAEVIGGVMLLNGSPVGKVLTIVFSVLGLVNVPIGTAVGIYSMWALLREIPPSTSVVNMPPNSPATY